MIRRSGLTRTSVFTQNLPDSYKSTDISDDKGITVLPPSFDIMKKGKPFTLERPQFKRGSQSAIVDESISTFNIARLNKRSGLGNNTILRDSFKTPDVIGRQPTDYALAELIDRQQQGIKVQLSDKTLNDLFQVKTVDPKDYAWIAEYNRRLAAGETKEQLAIAPPFGREQRVMFKRINFGAGVSLSEGTSLSISEELKLLRDAVTAGSSSSDLVNILAKLLELTTKFDAFTSDNMIMLAEILAKTGAVDPDPKIYFGTGYHRFWDSNQVLADLPKMILFLCANAKDPKAPVRSLSKVVIGVKQMLINLAKGSRSDVFDSSGKPAPKPPYYSFEQYLDVDYKILVIRDDVIAAVDTGIDNGEIGGLPPPPVLGSGGVPVAGKWLTTSEDDKASAASTKPMPPPKPKPPPTPEPPRDPSEKRKGKIDKAITALRLNADPTATLPKSGVVSTFKESEPDVKHKTYEVDEPRTIEMFNSSDIYKVGSKWYRKGA